MTRTAAACLCVIAVATASQLRTGAAEAAGYTRLVPIDVKILAAAEAFPGGAWRAQNVLVPGSVGSGHPDYASHGLGVKTFIDFDLGAAVRLAAFRHVQRRTSDTVAEACLVLSDAADFGHELARVKLKHVDEPGATTFVSFAPVKARYVRWQVTSVLPGRSTNVGGQRIEFFAAVGEPEPKPAGIGIEAKAAPIVEGRSSERAQPLKLTLDYPYAEPVPAVVAVEGQQPRRLELVFGRSTLPYTVGAVDSQRSLKISVDIGGRQAASRTVVLPPLRRLTVYILPHSHNDIGYTAVQTDIEEKQVNNLLQGLADARRTADYPEGARFVWNVEVLWGADLLLRRLPAKEREEFLDGVRRGQIALNGMYLNELTGLCRPEELLRLFRQATRLGEQTGVPVDSAMISDVPGYTWGTVTAMNQAGIRYFSVAPNWLDRIGDVLVEWENNPFWWIGPDGKSRVLVWIPFRGYAMSHIYNKLSPQFVADFCQSLEDRRYPYDIAYMRWSGHGDNAVPDPAICDLVKEWNATHDSPRFIISSTSQAFRAFEQRYGDQLPQVRGDWTPYWEDGAGSSAAETAMNRASSERLAQAETLWAMLDPKSYAAKSFDEAWNNVLLYSEHTWGAYCSVSEPASLFTADQWNIKQSYAAAANLESRRLLSEAAQRGAGFQAGPPSAPSEPGEKVSQVDIYNTTSWPRTAVVVLPHEVSEAGNFVMDDQRRPVAAQRLASGELAVLVRDLTPLAGRRYTIAARGAAAAGARATAGGATLANEKLLVRLDEKTGAIVELRALGIDANLADLSGGHAVNDYLYMVGDDPAAVQRNGPVKIRVLDGGPLVASLLVESDAPGCHKLVREIRVAAGGDYLELFDTVDKKRLVAENYYAKEGKESVNFAFPFHVPGGRLRLDVPLGVVRPESDQIPSACKNWFTVGRWADVANADFGVTWVTLDAPLVEVGGITATLLNSQTDPGAWRKRIEPTQKLYAWVMNNHWHTNYRAYQEGPVQFRFVVRPHRGPCGDAEASRFAIGFSQPLVAVPGRGKAPIGTARLRIEPDDVIVTGLKPSDDGTAIIVRLLGVGGKPARAKLDWAPPAPVRLWLSDTSERPRREVVGDVEVPPWGLVTLRADLPQ